MTRTVPNLVLNSVVVGELVTSELWNETVKVLNDFLDNKPMYRGTATGGVSIANNTWTGIPYDINWIDSDSGHSTITNNTRYTCQVAGIYWVKGCAVFSGTAATGRIDVDIWKNNASYAGAATFLTKTTNFGARYTTSGLIRLAVGDFIEIRVRQITGGALALDQDGTGLSDPDFNVIWIST